MKENKAFRIPFITKADMLCIEFSLNLNTKYKEVPQSSISFKPQMQSIALAGVGFLYRAGFHIAI